VGGNAGNSKKFNVRIDNISDQGESATPIAPGVAVVHNGDDPIYTVGKADRGQGLEALAEDANPSLLTATLAGASGIASVAVFNTPVGATSAGPALPGGAYEFTVHAAPGQRLSFATMFGQSNDLFFGPDGAGIALFGKDGQPASGDVSTMVHLWDAGTEENEAPGMGPNQAPRQSEPNAGPAEGRISLRVDTTRALPLATAFVDIMVTEVNGTFTIELRNISDTKAFVSPISPVLHVLHGASFSLFTPGMAASDGLEHLAEDGNPGTLAAELSGKVDEVAVAGTKPTLPGQSVAFSVKPKQTGARLSLATMVGQTNDAFIGTVPAGIMLLNGDGQPRPAAEDAVSSEVHDPEATTLRHRLVLGAMGKPRGDPSDRTAHETRPRRRGRTPLSTPRRCAIAPAVHAPVPGPEPAAATVHVKLADAVPN